MEETGLSTATTTEVDDELELMDRAGEGTIDGGLAAEDALGVPV